MIKVAVKGSSTCKFTEIPARDFFIYKDTLFMKVNNGLDFNAINILCRDGVVFHSSTDVERADVEIVARRVG